MVSFYGYGWVGCCSGGCGEWRDNRVKEMVMRGLRGGLLKLWL